MGGGGARSAGRWWHSAFVKTQKGIGSPLVLVPRSRSPASPQKVGISQHPRFNSRTGDRSETYRVRARADGASGEKCRAKTKLDETSMIPAVPRRHEPENANFVIK